MWERPRPRRSAQSQSGVPAHRHVRVPVGVREHCGGARSLGHLGDPLHRAPSDVSVFRVHAASSAARPSPQDRASAQRRAPATCGSDSARTAQARTDTPSVRARTACCLRAALVELSSPDEFGDAQDALPVGGRRHLDRAEPLEQLLLPRQAVPRPPDEAADQGGRRESGSCSARPICLSESTSDRKLSTRPQGVVVPEHPGAHPGAAGHITDQQSAASSAAAARWYGCAWPPPVGHLAAKPRTCPAASVSSGQRQLLGPGVPADRIYIDRGFSGTTRRNRGARSTLPKYTSASAGSNFHSSGRTRLRPAPGGRRRRRSCCPRARPRPAKTNPASTSVSSASRSRCRWARHSQIMYGGSYRLRPRLRRRPKPPGGRHPIPSGELEEIVPAAHLACEQNEIGDPSPHSRPLTPEGNTNSSHAPTPRQTRRHRPVNYQRIRHGQRQPVRLLSAICHCQLPTGRVLYAADWRCRDN